MKITAQLALSQMKVNKKRTIAGIFAIALATSLITTVMCFVTSANKMLTGICNGTALCRNNYIRNSGTA